MATVGIGPYLANGWLNTLRNTGFSVPVTCVQLHTGIPGVGASSLSNVTTRQAITFNAASNGIITITGAPPVFNMTGDETITHVSLWDALTSGNFLLSGTLLAPVTVANGDVLAPTAFTTKYLTLAAA